MRPRDAVVPAGAATEPGLRAPTYILYTNNVTQGHQAVRYAPERC